MTIKGWIKLFRREFEWFKDLSNPEIVYLLAARVVAEWDNKKEQFGTFDARIKEMQKILGWSDGTISRVGKLLLSKGYFHKTDDHRRWRITNAELFFSKGGSSKKAEKIILDTETNLQTHELNLQISEYFPDKIKQGIKDLKDKMSVSDGSKKKNQEDKENTNK